MEKVRRTLGHRDITWCAVSNNGIDPVDDPVSAEDDDENHTIGGWTVEQSRITAWLLEVEDAHAKRKERKAEQFEEEGKL